MRFPASLPKLPLLMLLCLAGLGVIGACASQAPRLSVGQQHDQTSKPVAVHPNWSKTKIAQRDFVVDQILYDDQAKPWKLWLISAPHQGQREAVEFFTGESVKNIKDVVAGTYLSSSRTDEPSTYSFTDAKGRRYDSRNVRSSNIDLDQPTIYAGWERHGRGHDVILGAYLFKEEGFYDQQRAYKTRTTPVDPSRFFNGKPTCDAVAYVAKTQGSRFYETDNKFTAKAKILADYDVSRACWNTKSYRALDLEDNTFIIATANHVFRINSFDLTPAGAAPDLRLIDVKEK